MKADELMIGDWVNLKNGKVIMPCRITVIGHATQDRNEIGTTVCVDLSKEFPTCIFDMDVITPIPLTPEILEKNNFRKVIWQGRRCTEITTYAIGEGLNLEEDNDGFDLVDNCSDLGDYGYESNYICDIKYVHELQHALKLCEIDKTIEP